MFLHRLNHIKLLINWTYLPTKVQLHRFNLMDSPIQNLTSFFVCFILRKISETFILYSIFFLEQFSVDFFLNLAPKWKTLSLRSVAQGLCFGESEEFRMSWETLFSTNTAVSPKTQAYLPVTYSFPGIMTLGLHFCV